MTNVITYAGKQHIICTCPSCMVPHSIPMTLYEVARQRGLQIFCPNGHVWTYTQRETHERELEKLRSSLDHERGWRVRLEAEVASTRRTLMSYRMHLARAKKRILQLRTKKGARP